MNMSRYIVMRILAISIVILLAGTALALWRAQFDVEREERGAADEVRLFEVLYAIENGPEEEIEANLEALRAINASRNLRHIRFSLVDGNGVMLVAPNEDDAPGFLQNLFARFAPGTASSSAPWLLQRDDGRKFYASLSLDPASEQQEALDNLEGMLLVIGGFALIILIAVYVTLTRALAPMRLVLDAIDRYRRNDFDARLPKLPFAETDAIGGALNHMADTLDTSQEQRRALSLKLVSSQEDERLRIARELHDEFGQSLTAMRVDLSWLSRRTETQAELHDVIRGMSQQCEALQGGIRDLLNKLRPIDMRSAGFASSLQKLLDDLIHSWNARLGETTRFDLEYAVSLGEISDDVASALYRLSQEALTNAVRHAHARRVNVSIVRDGDAVRWSVRDDGVGIADVAASVDVGNGIAGMRERVWALGSDLDIAPVSNDPERPGLALSARFPIRG
jgi:two-component system, NarL family, sensor histidine kinase UhpB